MSADAHVAIYDEHEIFRRGLHASLAGHPGLVVDEVAAAPAAGAAPPTDVVVVSHAIAASHRFHCPLVLCADERGAGQPLREGNAAAAVLHRTTLTPRQLVAAVLAAVAGLRVDGDLPTPSSALDDRAVRVLQLLATGRSTREIADELSYSERTIKKEIQGLEDQLGARSRPHAVAEAIRQGLI